MTFSKCAALLFICLVPTASFALPCTEKNATAADEYIDQLTSWQAINTMQQKYHACDDGEIAEGISDVQAKLMISNWSDLTSLNQLFQKNNKLEPFILKHINSTLDTDTLEKLQILSAQRCPDKTVAGLCKSIQRAATDSLN